MDEIPCFSPMMKWRSRRVMRIAMVEQARSQSPGGRTCVEMLSNYYTIV